MDLKSGNISKSLIIFSLPMIAGNLIQQLYNFADTLIVGRTIGATALSAVGSSYTLMTLLIATILGLCMGSGVVFSQLYGASKINDMKISIVNAFFFTLFFTLIINITSFVLLDEIIVWINIPTEAVQFTKEYLSIIMYGFFFVFIYNFFAAMLRSIGNTVVPLIFLAISAITNIVLDFVFIVNFNLSVEGAALATVIAQALSAILIVVYYFWKFKKYAPNSRHFIFSKPLLKLIVSNSLLTAIQQSVMNLGILMVQGLVNSFGLTVSAAYAIAGKLNSFVILPCTDFANAYSIFVAQNYGARKGKRIRKGTVTALLISSVFCMIVSACVLIFTEPLLLLFVDSSEVGVIAVGVEYLHVEGMFYVLLGILLLLYGLYRGLGRPLVGIIITILSLGTRVALAYTLAPTALGIMGIWWAIPIGWILADSFGLLYYQFKIKKQMAHHGFYTT